MKWEEDIEKRTGNKFILFLKGIILFLAIRLFLDKMIYRKFIKHFDWKKCKSKIYIGVYNIYNLQNITTKEFIKTVKTLIKQKDTKKVVKFLNTINNENNYNILYPTYISDDGIYEFLGGETFLKISNKTIPMWMAVRASFWTPPFRPIRFKIKNEKFMLMDGGVVNNEANIPFIGKEYIQLSCSSEERIKEDPIGYFYYSKQKPEMYCLVTNKTKDTKFFSFYDELIDTEFNEPATNFFK
jgi:hypothetical protein